MATGPLTAYAFVWYSPNSNDHYNGIVFDDGTYGYTVGQCVLGPCSNTESGSLNGIYYIYGSCVLPGGSAYSAGDVTLGNWNYACYWDAQSGRDLPFYYDSNIVAGVSGLGSEHGYVYNGTAYEYVGNDYYEADYRPALAAYSFWWYSPNSGDYYYGTAYDDGTYGYAVGEYVFGPSPDTESGGFDGYYYIYASGAAAAGYAAGEVTTGNADFASYHDAGSGRDLALLYDSATVTGTAGLGSESNYADNGTAYEYVGNDYYEADSSTVDGFIYDYTATETVSGDIQYGYVYDDGTYGYSNGYSFYSISETGGYWHYQVYSASPASFEPSLIGAAYIYSYYDGETGALDTPYFHENGSAAGTDGLGSGFDYVDFGTGIYDTFSSYEEADVPGAETDQVFYYYAYNTESGDIYWGQVYDDGLYGYFAGYSTQFYLSDEDGVGYTFYDIYDAIDLGYDSPETGYNYVSSYYDGETGQYGTPAAYAAGNPSGFSGLGSEFDTVDFGGGKSGIFGYGFYEADPA